MSFLRRYVFSTDHKVVAKQFLWSGLIFLLIGGLLAMVMRWQWAHPGDPVWSQAANIASISGIPSSTPAWLAHPAEKTEPAVRRISDKRFTNPVTAVTGFDA